MYNLIFIRRNDYFFMSSMPLPGPLRFALQMLQYCIPGTCQAVSDVTQKNCKGRHFMDPTFAIIVF